MNQTVTIDWFPVAYGEMPREEGTYLVAFSDNTVESYPIEQRDIQDGEIRVGSVHGQYWARGIPHPDDVE